MPLRGTLTADTATCAWCSDHGTYHVGAGNYWRCPICRPGPLHWVERKKIEATKRPLPPGYQEALDRDDALGRLNS